MYVPFSTDLLFQVTFASLVGGIIQNPTCQVYVLITGETTNANDIKSLCAEELGLDTISLVTANGLPIEDSDGIIIIIIKPLFKEGST